MKRSFLRMKRDASLNHYSLLKEDAEIHFETSCRPKDISLNRLIIKRRASPAQNFSGTKMQLLYNLSEKRMMKSEVAIYVERCGFYLFAK